MTMKCVVNDKMIVTFLFASGGISQCNAIARCDSQHCQIFAKLKTMCSSMPCSISHTETELFCTIFIVTER